MTGTGLDLADGMLLADLAYPSLWASYFALGGSGSLDDVREHVESCACADTHEHNLIAQAINEAFLERGQDHPVAYRDLSTLDDAAGGGNGQ